MTDAPRSRRFPRFAALVPLLALLGGCQAVVLHPAGDVAVQQRDLILASTGLMLLIVLPVMAATALFAWRYRRSNTAATYAPDWHHSTQLEVMIWAAPLAIVVALGALTWISTHVLDPYRPVARLGPNRPVPASTKPLNVEVVALDWKWLFIYPDLGVATVNTLATPVDTPVNFRITASSVMNSFYLPTLAGQIYAMPGMETQLHAVADRPVTSEGFSANYSGSGFSDMRFGYRAMSAPDFARWVARVRAGGGRLDRAGYLDLAKPSEREPVRTYAAVEPALYPAVVGMCVAPGQACMTSMSGDMAGMAPPSTPTHARLTAEPGPASADPRAAPLPGRPSPLDHPLRPPVGPAAPSVALPPAAKDGARP